MAAEHGASGQGASGQGASGHDGADGIVSITDVARQKILEIMDNQGIRGRGAIRVQIQGRGPGGWNYGMSLEEDAEPEPGDAVQDEGDFKVLVGADTLDNLRGATIDFVDGIQESGFKIENPNAVASCGCGHSFQVEDEGAADVPHAAAGGGCGSGCSH